MKPSEYLDLKEQVENLDKRANQIRGAINQLKKELKEEFGCRTSKKAEIHLDRLKQQEIELEEQFTKLFRKFEKKYGENNHG